MIDLKGFIDENMNEKMQEALSKMPPKQRADVNRMVQSFSGSMGDIAENKGGSPEEIMKAYTKFKTGLDKDIELHDKMQEKYGDISNK